MRKFICAIFCVAALFFSGCDNPINSVGLTANPDGTFGVDVTFKNGATINFPSISPGQLAQLQRKYNIHASQIITRSASPCEVVNLQSFAIASRAPSMRSRLGRAFGAGCGPCDVLPTPDTPAPVPAPSDPIVWGTAPVDASRHSNLEARVSALESKMDKILALVEQIKK